MCPGINVTCCTKEDQLQIYGKYVQSKEKAQIYKHYEIVRKIYFGMLKQLINVDTMSKKIVKRQKLKRIGNCKLMAERFLSYDVPTYNA